MARQKDRFDSAKLQPGRVGAHRGPKRRGGGWLALLWIVLGTVVLTSVGLFAASRVLQLDLSIPWLAKPTTTAGPNLTSAPPVVTNPAEIDPARGITIIILNGTPVAGLQGTVAGELTALGWPIRTSANAGQRDILDTVVYYSNPFDLDVARGLVEALGVGEVRQVDPDTYPGASITIVLGMDHPLVPKPEPATEAPPAEG